METNFANYGLKAELAVTPKSPLKRSLSSRFDATTTVFKAFRIVGDTIFQAETFRVGPRYGASRSVGDNGDQDRYTDNTPLDPPALIISGDLDKNNNGTFDYEDDILLFDVDEDFLDESDRNNNGIRDEEENDKDPNYEIDGEQVSARIRLRQIEHANVRDMASAFILKTVYQFTKTIKITGGGQILFLMICLMMKTILFVKPSSPRWERASSLTKRNFSCTSVHDILINVLRVNSTIRTS